MQMLLMFLALFQPVHEPEAAKLAAFMVKAQPKAVFYARPLAERIFEEAKAFDLDPTVLAAMVWMESWFDEDARGSDHERGLWQLYPYASRLGAMWAVMRQSQIVPRKWDRPWSRMSVRTRQEISRDINLATLLAADLISVFVKHCRTKHRDHRRPTDAYAHFNSGFRWPRPGYSYQLWQRTKTIRRAIGRPPVTWREKRWIERTAPGG